MDKKTLIVLIVLLVVGLSGFLIIKKIVLNKIAVESTKLALEKVMTEVRDLNFDDAKTFTASRNADGYTSLHVGFGIDHGFLTIKPVPGKKLDVNAQYLGVEPVIIEESSGEGDGALLNYVINSGDSTGENRLISIPRDVYYVNLDMVAGAGVMDIDLTGIEFENASLSLSVGEAEIVLPSTDGTKLNVGTGIGSVVIRVPSDVGFQLSSASGVNLSNIDLPNNVTEKDEVFYSSNYQSAESKTEISVAQGSGSLTVLIIE